MTEIRKILKYISEETNKTAINARTLPDYDYDTVCNTLAKDLDEKLSVQGTRVFMINPDSGQNGTIWPIVYKSDNTLTTSEDPATRIELFSQIQTKADWLCKKQVNGQAIRTSSTTGVPTLYSSSSVLNEDTGLVRFVLKAAVPYNNGI